MKIFSKIYNKTMVTVATITVAFSLFACEDKKSDSTSSTKNDNEIVFATSSMYPPFEYHEDGKLVGFDIDIAQAVAEKLNKKAVFEDYQFSAVLAALESNKVDAAIATIAATEKRKEKFDFSEPYYFEAIAAIFRKDDKVNEVSDLDNKKIVCQLGTTMEIWLKQQKLNGSQISTVDMPNQAIEMIKSGQADVALIDEAQAYEFSTINKELNFKVLAQSNEGYAIVVNKNSPLLKEVNKAISQLKEDGTLTSLEDKWLKFDNSDSYDTEGEEELESEDLEDDDANIASISHNNNEDNNTVKKEEILPATNDKTKE